MSEYKLTYFDFGGRGELTRLIFAVTGTPFVDERIAWDGFQDKKDVYPNGTLPVLTTPELTLTQSLVISRFVARRCDFAGKTEADEFFLDAFVQTLVLDIDLKVAEIFFTEDAAEKTAMISARKKNLLYLLHRLEGQIRGDFVLGDSMSYADLAVFDFAPWLPRVFPDAPLPPKLREIADKVAAHPNIAAYLAKLPVRQPKTDS